MNHLPYNTYLFEKMSSDTFIEAIAATGDRDRSVLNRVGLTRGNFTIPKMEPSQMAVIGTYLQREGKTTGGDPTKFLEAPLKYLTPQNVNRLAMLGGVAAGGVAGGSTPRSYVGGLAGSAGGAIVGGYASQGLNRAIDAYRGLRNPDLASAYRRIQTDVLLPSAGALAGGYLSGKYL